MDQSEIMSSLFLVGVYNSVLISCIMWRYYLNFHCFNILFAFFPPLSGSFVLFGGNVIWYSLLYLVAEEKRKQRGTKMEFWVQGFFLFFLGFQKYTIFFLNYKPILKYWAEFSAGFEKSDLYFLFCFFSTLTVILTYVIKPKAFVAISYLKLFHF